MTPDCQLLRSYAENRSEEAFAELVRRHVDLVYSAALRQVNGDEFLARDVAQCVFSDLARKAAALADRSNLSGWLFTSTRFAAIKAVRTEQRRCAREQKAQSMCELPNDTPPAEPDWQTLRPILDEVMLELKEADREAILLRYFENRALAEVGARLGISENSARMRVQRALEKLREQLLRRGLTSTVALASVLSAHAVQTAPAGLATALTSASIAAAGTGTAFSIMKILTLTKLKLAVGVLAVAGGATTMVVQHQQLQEQRTQAQSLQAQVAELQADNARLSTLATNRSRSLTEAQMNELLRLRGEVALLRQQTGAVDKLRRDNQQLRADMSKTAENAMQQADYFQAYQTAAVNALKQIGLAMHVYAQKQSNNHQFPTNFEMMKLELGNAAHFNGPMGTPIEFDAFEFVNPGLVGSSTPQAIAAREKAPRQAPDGKWNRAYLLADGSVQLATSPDGNFDAWEKDYALPAANQ